MLAAENLWLRTQLAFDQERHVAPRRATEAARSILVWLACWFDWRQALVIGQPQTLPVGIVRGFAGSGAGKLGLDARRSLRTLQALIRRMARENPSWGEERIANELLLQLGLRVSPRTIRKYLPKREALPADHRYRCLSLIPTTTIAL